MPPNADNAAMPELDQKSRRILTCAREVFARHGYRKTSMQDIAHAAGLSRAALYQRFRNKEDVFRQGAEMMQAEVLERTRTALEADTEFGERLRRAMLAFTEGLLQPLDAAGHGQELFAASRDLAASVEAGHRAALRRLLREHLEQARTRGEITLPPASDSEQLAELLHITATACKHEGDGVESLRRRIGQLARLFASALAPAVGRA